MQGLRRAFFALLAVLFLALLPGASVHAQSSDSAVEETAPPVKIDRRKLLVQPRNADGSIAQASFFEDPVLWMRDKQQAFYGKMSSTLRSLRGSAAREAAWTLMLLSFGYGVFHAAGPGHGKAVISAWLLATENDLRRGVLISFMSAIIQALTAIVLVSVLFLFVASVAPAARDMAGFLESASYGLIALLGLYLVWTAVRALLPKRTIFAAPAPAAVAGTPVQAIQLHRFETFEPLKNNSPAPEHVHGPDCGCGHEHLPAAAALRGDWSLAKAFSLSFAVGIRPCTGAILVLIAAYGLGFMRRASSPPLPWPWALSSPYPSLQLSPSIRRSWPSASCAAGVAGSIGWAWGCASAAAPSSCIWELSCSSARWAAPTP